MAVGGLHIWVSLAEQIVANEIANRLGYFGLLVRPLPLGQCLVATFFRFLTLQLLSRPRGFGSNQPNGNSADARQQGEQHQTRGDHLPTIPPHELLQAIPRARRAGADRLVIQEALDIFGKAVGRLIPAVAVLAQGFEHDPVEFPLHEPAQLLRLDLAVGRDTGE